MAEVVNTVSKKMGYAAAEDLYNTVGYGGVSISKIAIKLHDEYKRTFKARIAAETPPATNEEIISAAKHAEKPKNVRSNSGILVDGESGCQVKFAKCCNPLPGDPVIGFITKGYGISIHKQDCPNVINGVGNQDNDGRWVRAEWENENNIGGRDLYEALLQIHTENRIGMLADVSTALAELKVSILQVNCAPRADDTALISLTISCKSTEHYSSIVSRLRGLSGVLSVSRGFST
jgi:GTP pyrophosphokinase